MAPEFGLTNYSSDPAQTANSRMSPSGDATLTQPERAGNFFILHGIRPCSEETTGK
jgi:hypothetical protein